jgi:hypothetical protein
VDQVVVAEAQVAVLERRVTLEVTAQSKVSLEAMVTLLTVLEVVVALALSVLMVLPTQARMVAQVVHLTMAQVSAACYQSLA